MAMRAGETGGKKILEVAWVRTEPLPTRLYPVSRVPKSYQLKKQRREEKKRHRQRARTKGQREERMAAKAAEHAAKEARRLERQQQRAAKEVERLLRQQEREQQRVVKEAERLLRQRERQKRQEGKREKSRGTPPRFCDEQAVRCPLLLPSPGRLPPPHRLMHKENPLTGDYGPAQEAGP